MTDFTTYAAAFLLLTGQVAGQPTPPNAPPIECQLPPAPGQPVHDRMSPHALAATGPGHIVVRWKGGQVERRHQPPHPRHHRRHRVTKR